MKKTEDLLNYMEWLKNFTNYINTFESDLYKYNDEGITELDKKNVKNLGKLFRVIEQYADQNLQAVETHQKDYCTIKNYYIKYQDQNYKIGFICENITTFFCQRIERTKQQVIPIEKVIQSKTRKPVKSITNLKETPKLVRNRKIPFNHPSTNVVNN